MDYQTLELQRDGRRATVWLNRPDLRNAFNETAIAELTDAFLALSSDQDVRVIVLAAHGRTFCAGADLNWMKKMASYTHAENLADAAELADMLRMIYRCPKPVIAKIQGDCFGGGVGLAAVCDIVVAVDSAVFSLSEVKLGLIPATISPYVIKAMGEQAARRYFLTGERITVDVAHRIGLVHETVKPHALDAKIDELAGALLLASPHAVTEAKRLVQDIAGLPITDEMVADTVQRIAAIRSSAEGKEGVQSFLEKRKPNWLGLTGK
jgi:methylglutaconyl-CoA hydratase